MPLLKNLNVFFKILTFFAVFKLYAIDPAPKQNYFPVVLVNNTGQADTAVFFIGHGNDADGFPGFLVPDAQGIISFVYPDIAGTIGSASQSKTLSQLPLATNIAAIPAGATARLLYFPINVSSRAYASIQQALYLQTQLNASGLLAVDDPSVASRRDPNYLTLYQDFEFGMGPSATNSSTQVFLNLSYVDYYCLPYQLRTFSYPSNDPVLIQTSLTSVTAIPSGTEDDKTREQIITAVKEGFTMGEVSGNPSWQYLEDIFYSDPYNSSSSGSTLRILAAKSSISLGSSNTAFSGGHTINYFPSTYLSSKSKGPSANTSFLDAVYNHYKSPAAPLYVKIFPGAPVGGGPAPAPVIYGISSTANSLELLFTIVAPGLGPSGFTVNLGDVAPDKFWSGATWPFAGSPTPSVLYTNELSKALSSLFSAGHLPLTAIATSPSSPFINSNSEGFNLLTYFTQAPFSTTGPWSNLYCKVFHEQFLSKNQVPPLPANSAYGLAYAFDYDDLLNMSGIINGLFFQDQYGTPSTTSVVTPDQPYYLMVTLQSLDANAIPNIRNETYTYNNIKVTAATGGVKVTYRFSGASSPVAAPSSGAPAALNAVAISQANPLLVDFEYDGKTYTFMINPKQQIALPELTSDPYTVVHAFFQTAIVITRDTTPGSDSDPNLTINVNSSPPPYPYS